MKYLLMLVLLGAGYYFYTQRTIPQTLERPFGNYEMSELATRPMPKVVMLDGMKFYALDAVCKEANFQSFSRKTQAECESFVNASHAACKATALPAIPDLIHEEADIDRYSKSYLNCVLPTRG